MRLRSTLFLFLFVIILSLLTACDEKEDGIPPFLTIEIKTVNFKAATSTRDIVVQTSVENWSASVQPDVQSWLGVERRENTLRITVGENREADSRKAEIKVVADNLFETISVEQLGTAPAILVSSETFNLPADGGDISLEITSNIEYDVIIPEEVTWVKEKPDVRAGEMVKEEHWFQVVWNSDKVVRNAVLTVRQKGGDLKKEIRIVQKAQEGYSGESGKDIKDDIKVPVSNGKASPDPQPGGEIEKSFDNDFTTIYHSNWNNIGEYYFPITLDYHFQNQESIDYLVYYPRSSGSNGNFKEVEIWGATESEPVLKKLLDYNFNGSGSASKIAFTQPLIKPKTIRFVVKSGAGDGQGFASCAEMEFYRINPDNFNPQQLFVDQACTQLKPDITLDEIEKVSNRLYRNIALYLFHDQYPREFRIQEYKAWPHPDAWAKVNKTSTLSLLDNPTGIAVAKDEELIVFVGDTHGNTISLKIQDLDTPGEDGYNNASFYPLTTGVNKIKTRNKGLAYLFYHTSDYESAKPITVHFATGKVNGYFDSQKHDASEWSRLLANATNKHFDLLGKYAHLTFETAAFRSYAANNGPQLIAAYDDLVRLEQEFMGLMKYNRPTVNRAYFHVMYTSYMYATSYRTAYISDTQQDILSLQRFKSEPWGPAHETGHTLQTRPGFRWLGMTEVTNNVHSLYVQTQWGNPSRIETENMGRYNNRYEKAYHNSFIRKTPHPAEEDVFCKLVSLWQLQLYFANARGFNDTYKELYERVRTSPDKPTPGEQQLDFVRMMCDITQTDLTGFFTRWGYLVPYDGTIDDYGSGKFTITIYQIDQLINDIKEKNYSPMTEKIEYICDANWEIFKNRLTVQPGTATKSGSTITMNGWKNVVAYEVYEGEQLLFVSNRNSFTLDSPPTNEIIVYAVAYDGNKTKVTL
ncbi:M60 family metallopeptidase [Proteiniphilum sp.]|uniref:M60 family metallopeptidase n=1 Tax=Proteiniphilum sp. TaxID=1926877 RepID=UPI002B1ED656|nr:M60 family metallopeptidase [Proteiniphilum sp.]MEA4919149.1 M60 family metallopeptidase [Proteiniphilum sp.]